MTEVPLPSEIDQWPMLRVLTRSDYRGEWVSGWTEVPHDHITRTAERMLPSAQHLRVRRYTRSTFPQIGQATLTQEFGTIGTRRIAPMDLAGHWVRIQECTNPTEQDATLRTWSTVWFGRVETQRDTLYAAAASDLRGGGSRDFICMDFLHCMMQWPVMRHAYSAPGAVSVPPEVWSFDHPGFNLQGHDRGAPVTDIWGISSYRAHTIGGAGAAWTYADAIAQILAAGWPVNRAPYPIPEGLVWADLAAKELPPLSVSPGATVGSLLLAMLDWRRGICLPYIDWTDGAGDAFRLNLQIDAATDSSPSAVSSSVDLTGDHRVVADAFALDDADAYRVDRLETYGERIEVGCTLDYAHGGLAEGWNPTGDPLTDPDVATRHVLAGAWTGTDAGGAVCTIACTDAGQIERKSSPSLAGLEVLPSLPWYWYASGDPAASPAERLPAGVILPDWVRADMSIDGRAIIVSCSDDRDGLRTISDAADGYGGLIPVTISDPLADGYDDRLRVSVGLRLAERVRLGTGPVDGESRKAIFVSGAHLWQMAGGTQDPWSWSQGMRNVLAASDTIVRDDRAKMQAIHDLAADWYLVQSGADRRRGVTFALRAGPESAIGGTLSSRVGWFISTIRAAGTDNSVRTPVTRIDYNHDDGVTTYTTEWTDLDLNWSLTP
ncbi:MAG: hypothetical protein RLZZ524_932 [Pseudomonadota bacterium]